MLSEIGSNFWISPEDLIGNKQLQPPYSFGFAGSDYVWLSTGRSATRFVLKTIEERNPNIKKVALLPPFTCHTVIEPFLEFGYKVYTLPISDRLFSPSDGILRSQELSGATVILLHRYYGFDTLPNINLAVEDLKAKGVVIIEDNTQNLYSCYKPLDADYRVGSIRKWCGVPDGGFAICKDGSFTGKPTEEDDVMIEAKHVAAELKYKYLFEHIGDKPSFKAKFREAEELLDLQKDYYNIGKLSSHIQANLDIYALKEKRRANYNLLLNGIKSVKSVKIVFETLPVDVTPLYFPILVKDREILQSLLADNDIYAPVVWPKAECCPAINEEAEDIYKKILCIPIDQRYSIDDMERIVKVITDNYEN